MADERLVLAWVRCRAVWLNQFQISNLLVSERYRLTGDGRRERWYRLRAGRIGKQLIELADAFPETLDHLGVPKPLTPRS